MMCGTDPFPKDFKAKKYRQATKDVERKKHKCDSNEDHHFARLEKHALNKEDFAFIMRNLPVPVAESEIDEMFEFADKNQDGKLSFAEFELMVIENSFALNQLYRKSESKYPKGCIHGVPNNFFDV